MVERKKIAYLGVVGDLFHYGHLQSILFAKGIADICVVGVITDEGVASYRVKPIANLNERYVVIENLRCVDRVMVQQTRDYTENLQKLHIEHPDAEIILVHGDDLKDVPGAAYVRSIGGRLATHPYYERLSNFKIMQQILDRKDSVKDIEKLSTLIQNRQHVNAKDLRNKTIISTKASTLGALKPLLTNSKIEELFAFTTTDWKNGKEKVLQTIQEKFTGNIVVRSSAINEDTLDTSMAGCFESVLNVSAAEKNDIEDAIETVLHSYKSKDAESSFNQVLIQSQTENVTMSGVIFTRTLEQNAPYYVINYDDATGSTDSVTSGKENKMITISRFATRFPDKMANVMQAVKEIEDIIPYIPLDIEFGVSEDKVVIFQVRPLAINVHKTNVDEKVKQKIESLKDKFQLLAKPLDHLEGDATCFADMPDWNPAEIIGDHPNHLDYSLYDYIITNAAWHKARTSQGYYNVAPAKLVELFGTKPYVNVRHSFNSFTPSTISESLRARLVSFYLEKLTNNPHLQDKVEFDVLFTCYDFTFNEKAEELMKAGFTHEEVRELKHALLTLTNNLIHTASSSIEEDLRSVMDLEIGRRSLIESHTPQQCIDNARKLLDECKELGTIQFSRLARLGFIGKIMLHSLVTKNGISQEVYDSLFNSVKTVATDINDDFTTLSKEDFITKYYHLRPGTYDITSLRYEQNPGLLQRNMKSDVAKEESLVLDEMTLARISTTLQEHDITGNASTFITFFRKATEARELSKFEFTKNLSDALEEIANAGEMMGFTRKEIAMLDVQDILTANGDVQQITQQWKELIQAREHKREIDDQLVLNSVIVTEDDFDVIEHYKAKPNFITQKMIDSTIVHIEDVGEDIPDIEGSVVLIENGDPGYDWIFTRKIAGLITKYGGVASHMSIRCAEFGIPAAIGCGDLIFNTVKNGSHVTLDCKQQKIISRDEK